MPRKCSICIHPQRDEIEEAMIRGDSLRDIASRFAVGKNAVGRHKDNHLPTTLALATEAHEAARAGDLLGQMSMLSEKSYSILIAAEKEDNLGLALKAIREVRGCVDLQAKMLIALADRVKEAHDYDNDPDWWATRSKIMDALDPYPEARIAVAAALLGEDDNG